MPSGSKTNKILSIIERTLDFLRYSFSITILLIGLYFIMDSLYINTGGVREIFHQFVPIITDNYEKSDFKKMQQSNPDIIAWISVKGTPIDYPVLAGESNDEYLFMNENREYSSSGSIFIDSSNNKYFNDFNTIMYGHHMQYGSMFGSLDRFLDKDVFNKIKYGNLYYDSKDHRLEFFAFLDKVDGYDFEIYNPGIRDEGDKIKYIDNILGKAKYKRDIRINNDDRIILLSTCSQTMTNGRYILASRIVDAKNPMTKDKVKYDKSESIKIIGKLIAFLFIVFFILILLIHLRRRAA